MYRASDDRASREFLAALRVGDVCTGTSRWPMGSRDSSTYENSAGHRWKLRKMPSRSATRSPW